MTFFPKTRSSKLLYSGLMAAALFVGGATSAQAIDGAFGNYMTMSVYKTQGMVLVNEDAPNPSEKLISSLGDQAITALRNTSVGDEARRAEFDRLLNKHFDMDTIARFALGKYWGQATPAEQKEYVSLFKKMVINVYSKRFAEYSGQDFKVTGSKPAGRNDTLVNSAIIPQNGGPKVAVDWRIRNNKIIDVIVEGVSMSVTQRSEFASIIQRGGGNVSALIDYLKK